MSSSDRDPATTPDWAPVTPGVLDLRVLDQAECWVTAEAVVLRIAEVPTPHLQSIVTFLTRRAEELYTAAVLNSFWAVALADASGEVAAERLVWELTGRSIADIEPTVWLESTALMRGLRRELAARNQA
ncbi:hypothetical protein N866_02730 [Actinotalea ferrariae CF5-4]|uniref:Uncharacterized protein n=1 Tax=Actinotalea ferrariae CF5-4 TaxID=948458 RepID=A0A021VPR0_9CELL|nr:hypothetical protein [Actinotalea ferrariae]EYR63136.1 hypothetical protein N866_02730 [Actinotalea ferrariae CF5-4]